MSESEKDAALQRIQTAVAGVVGLPPAGLTPAQLAVVIERLAVAAVTAQLPGMSLLLRDLDG